MVLLRPLLVSVLALSLSPPVPSRRASPGTSFLHYKSTTKTITSSYTWQEDFPVYVTKGTITYITDTSIHVSTTKTVTRTVDEFPNLRKRSAVPEPVPAHINEPAELPRAVEDTRQAAVPRAVPVQGLKADSKGSVLGFASSVVSDACSCLVTKATPTTITEWKFKTKTVTYTETIPRYTAWTTTTDTCYDYSYVSIVHTKTHANPTTCGDAAHPTFFAQMRDADRTSTGQYDNNYLAMIYHGSRGIPNDPDVLAEASKKRAVLVTIEPWTGYLKTVPEGLYLNTDYFNNFELMYFSPKKEIDLRSFLYHTCKIVPRGVDRELVCSVPESFWKMHVYQACPQYVELFFTPMVIGAEVSKTSPDCFEKKFYVVDACA